MTLADVLDRAARELADAPYLSDKVDDTWQAISFAQARERAHLLACALIHLRLSSGDRGVLFAEGRSAWVVAELALLHIGGVSVPLSIKLQAPEVPFRVNHSEARVVFFSRLTWDKLRTCRHEFDHEVLLVLLDDDPDLLNEVALATGEVIGARLWSYTQLLQLGSLERVHRQNELLRRVGDLTPEHPATVSYTSGTTGNPKGIVLTHGNYVANCEASVELFNMPHGLRTLVILPIDHSFAHTVALYGALLRSMHLFFLDAKGGLVRNIPANLLEVRPQFLLTVPSLSGNFAKKIQAGVADKGPLIHGLFQMGLRAGTRLKGNGLTTPGWTEWLRSGLPFVLARLLIFPAVRKIFGGELEFMVGGGALLDIKQQEFFFTLGIPVFQGYGLTEASPIISANTPASHCLGTSGLILNNIELTIRDAAMGIVAAGQSGEIVIRGPSVMHGYLKNPQATDQVLVDGWLRTGDLGYVTPEGFLMVTGREKALLIGTDGEKSSPEEIEEAIVNTSPVIDQVVLFCDHRPYTVALIVPEPTALAKLAQLHSDPADLLRALEAEMLRFKTDPAYAGRFAAAWCPSAFALLDQPFTEDNGLVNSTLKLVRYKIAERHAHRIAELYEPAGRSSDHEANREALKHWLS